MVISCFRVWGGGAAVKFFGFLVGHNESFRLEPNRECAISCDSLPTIIVEGLAVKGHRKHPRKAHKASFESLPGSCAWWHLISTEDEWSILRV